jgi:hypothetical protein
MNMQRLFERMADCWGGEVRAKEVREGYMLLIAEDPIRGCETTFEVFPSSAKDSTGVEVQLVRVQQEGAEPVLVSPIPSAIIAVALR